VSSNSVLDKIKQIAVTNKVNTYARSANSDVSFLPLTIKQQKNIIKTALDVVLSPITFSITTTEIIKENIQSKTNLSIIDKPLILLALRTNSLGSSYVIDGEEKDIVDLAECLKKRDAVNIADLAETLTFDNLEITTKVPSLEEDYRVNLDCKRVLDSRKSNDNDKVKDLIGEVYVYEIIKFIDNIKVTIDNKTDEIKFNILSINQKVETVESLPMAVTTKLIQSIANIRKVESEPLKVLVGDKEVTINLDTSFFTKE